MSDAANSPLPEMPTAQSGNPAESLLRATPYARGSAVMSSSIATTGAQVDTVCPWISEDIQNVNQIHHDKALEYFLHQCTDGSVAENAKAELLKTSLKAVLSMCNAGIIKKHIIEL